MASCVIRNNDDLITVSLVIPVATIGFEPVEYSISEGAGVPVIFMFRLLSGNLGFPVNVLFFTSNGSAQGKVLQCVNTSFFFHTNFEADYNVLLLSIDVSDYVGVFMEFTITGTEIVSVPVNITDDGVQEGGETFFGNLAAGSGAQTDFTNIAFDPILATANIIDDDGNDDWELGGEGGVHRERVMEGMEGGSEGAKRVKKEFLKRLFPVWPS